VNDLAGEVQCQVKEKCKDLQFQLQLHLMGLHMVQTLRRFLLKYELSMRAFSCDENFGTGLCKREKMLILFLNWRLFSANTICLGKNGWAF
jgi:hypothetical protein